MVLPIIKKAIKKTLAVFGLEVHRVVSHSKYCRTSSLGALQQVKEAGLLPATVIDVGAAQGSFTLQCQHIFPEARYLLVEPLEEFKPYIKSIIEIVPNAEYILAAASSKAGEVIINVHPDLVGSSLYLESENSDVNGIPRTVPAVTIDNLCRDCKAESPYLIKIDVQGAELDVLSGAEEIIKKAEYIILEVSLFGLFKGGPQFYDIVAFMKLRGFVVYDVLGLQYRPLDNAMSQVDIVFVKEKGLLRRYHFYAAKRQRKEQNNRIRRVLAKKNVD